MTRKKQRWGGAAWLDRPGGPQPSGGAAPAHRSVTRSSAGPTRCPKSSPRSPGSTSRMRGSALASRATSVQASWVASSLPGDIDVVGVWNGTPHQVASVSSTANRVTVACGPEGRHMPAAAMRRPDTRQTARRHPAATRPVHHRQKPRSPGGVSERPERVSPDDRCLDFPDHGHYPGRRVHHEPEIPVRAHQGVENVVRS